MTKKIPYHNDYALVDNNELISKWLLWLSVITSIVTVIISKSKPFDSNENAITILNAINSILTVGYFFSDIIGNYLFYQAERNRRDDFFDNSLSTKLSIENTEEYYSNDNVSPGIEKMGVNSFENSFFSKEVSKQMLPPLVYKSIAVIIIFLILALFTDREILSTALQALLPLTILQQTIRLFLYNKRVNDVFKKYQSIFSVTTDGNKQLLIIHTMTSYETVLSWACIKLDSKIFNKLNDSLTIQWEQLKKKYSIG
jgi:hypothetical protein